MAGGSRRVRRLMARGLLRRTPLKKGLLISPKDHWPALDGGICMESAGFSTDGKQLFKYTHSANYQVRLGSCHTLAHGINWDGKCGVHD